MLTRLVPAATAALCVLAGCGSEPATVMPADYRTALQDVCLRTTAALDDLPEPPESISVEDFAASAADLLASEADEVRDLDVPDELDADHRAFVRNTDEQAAAWRSIAADAAPTTGTEPPTDGDFSEATNRIGELILGRNDLVDDMNAPGCHRGAV